MSDTEASEEDMKGKKEEKRLKENKSPRSQSRNTSLPQQLLRQASVYDAVAGRIDSDGFIKSNSKRIMSRNGFPCTETTFSPLDVLLRRVAAPTTGRADVYLADKHLAPDVKLPDSELLKAVHAYASDFYSSNTPDGGKCVFRSLDETALIAMGLLLEETAAQVLGDTGDMALVEPEGFDTFVPESPLTQMQVHGRVPRVETPPYVSEDSSGEEAGENQQKAVENARLGRKRRRS